MAENTPSSAGSDQTENSGGTKEAAKRGKDFPEKIEDMLATLEYEPTTLDDRECAVLVEQLRAAFIRLIAEERRDSFIDGADALRGHARIEHHPIDV